MAAVKVNWSGAERSMRNGICKSICKHFVLCHELLAGEIILIAIMDSANIIMNYLIIKVTFTETLQRPNHRYLQIHGLIISARV